MEIHFLDWNNKDEKGFSYELFLAWYAINFPNSPQVTTSGQN